MTPTETAPTTKIYHNTTDEPIFVLGLSDTPIEPHDHISITTKYPPQIVLENYPGVVDVTALSAEDQDAFYSKEKAAIDKAAAPKAAVAKAQAEAQHEAAMDQAEVQRAPAEPASPSQNQSQPAVQSSPSNNTSQGAKT